MLMTKAPQTSADLAAIWCRRWLPTYGLMVVTVIGAYLLLAPEPPEDSELPPRRALPVWISLPGLVAVFGGFGWLDWRLIRQHPEAPEKWLFSRGRRT
ncbi:hypothetical protein ACRARG_20420 [Pseudooceanicola sp. C21-150M6]|uniref:hypothetical protein n=1 Tax=Pseudooceanicola sp. C21-150M6 TaxID=3434355 RepID=UPI003D7F9EDC